MKKTIFGPRARALVWIAIGVSAIATVVAILWGAKLAEPVPGAHDSYTDGPLGSRALAETFEALGKHVLRVREGDFARIRAPLLFFEPDDEAIVDGRPQRLADVLSARETAGLVSIVVLPKWRWDLASARPSAVPDEDRAADVLEAALPGATLAHDGALEARMAPARASGSLGDHAIELPWAQLIEGGDAQPMLAHERGGVLIARHGATIVVSDPDLAHSWNLQRADHARIWAGLAGSSDAIAIDEVFHGHGQQRSLAAALGEMPTLLLTVHALFVLLVVVWLGSARFGSVRDLDPPRHGPAESIAVSAFVLAEGRPIGTLTESYVRELIADLAVRLGLAPGRSIDQQIAHVDAIATRRGEGQRAATLMRRAEALGAVTRDARLALTIAQDAHAMYTRLLQTRRV